jgi:hypothetical protein
MFFVQKFTKFCGRFSPTGSADGLVFIFFLILVVFGVLILAGLLFLRPFVLEPML